MLKAIFGLMSLLIVLAIIGTLGKKQFEALGLSRDATTRARGQGAEAQAVTNAVMGRAATVAVPGGVPGATPAPVEGTLPAQSRAIQSNVRDAANAALQQGANRSSSP
jgi:hypothetical protein